MGDRIDLERLRYLDVYDRVTHFWPRPARVRILFLCEGLQFDESSGFSFKIVLDLLRAEQIPFVNFEITLATWGTAAGPIGVTATPGPYQAKYTNYRFSKSLPSQTTPLLHQFDEVWLFGISPNQDQPVARAAILASSSAPDDQDLRVLSAWMDSGGGVLAMGDHASLGAHLCARIPRVWTMRRWTAEDLAPPRVGEARVDTNQPTTALQDPTITSPPAQNPFEAQSDSIPQPLELVPQPRYSVMGWRPHPVLCGGRLGAIDVFPDHPHEGWIRDTWEIDLTADVAFPPTGGQLKEYPTVGGVQPRPAVIAWGNTLADPPMNQLKGNSPAKRFGVVGVYNGHSIDHGRVVVDSTWHHWMSINLSGTYEGMTGFLETGGPTWEKIKRYYLNVAIWLARRTQQDEMLRHLVFWAAISPSAFEEWTPTTRPSVLGRELRDVLSRLTSDCFVSTLVFDPDRFRIFERIFPIRRPFPDPCLSCPSIVRLEELLLGHMLQQALLLRDEVMKGGDLAKLDAAHFEKRATAALRSANKSAFDAFGQQLIAEADQLRKGARELISFVESDGREIDTATKKTASAKRGARAKPKSKAVRGSSKASSKKASLEP